jgi:5-methylcytosine-specific restriction endonuclease McrA
MSNRAFDRRRAYQWYLGSVIWKKRSFACLERANGICERCGKRPATEAHHITYIRVFNEHPDDLQALCRECHEEVHLGKPANDNQLVLPYFDFSDDDEDGE